tara:strand:+ start:94 stop:315 length:222 start_codon:yes stop_codon:yes gene_type:complete
MKINKRNVDDVTIEQILEDWGINKPKKNKVKVDLKPYSALSRQEKRDRYNKLSKKELIEELITIKNFYLNLID